MGQNKAFQNIRWGLIMVALATVTAEDPLFTCDFETGDLCGMEQWKNDEFDWTRHSGRTPTGRYEGTGPRGAHVGNYYIYIESSRNHYSHRAYISTPAIRHSGDICVRFYYSMYGDSIAVLAVFTEQQRERNPVWREEGDKGDPWFGGQVTVKEFTDNDKVVFLGRAGRGDRGDIAIDYLRIHAGECNACQENNGGCDTLCVKLTESPYSECQCRHGYHIESDNPYKCVDIDECRDAKHGCSHTCQNMQGGYECQCPDGYSLGPDMRVCQDITCIGGVLAAALLTIAIAILAALYIRSPRTLDQLIKKIYNVRAKVTQVMPSASTAPKTELPETEVVPSPTTRAAIPGPSTQVDVPTPKKRRYSKEEMDTLRHECLLLEKKAHIVVARKEALMCDVLEYKKKILAIQLERLEEEERKNRYNDLP